jgi:diphthine methyl ester acylhydrolase
VQTLRQSSAILDLRFNRTATEANIMAVVSSTGSLAIFELDSEDSVSPLRHIATSRCDDIGEDVLFLQCQWHPCKFDILAVTTSTGLARLLRLNEKWEIVEFTDLDIGNSLEAWCIEFSPPAPEAYSQAHPITIYCGGDDSMLRFISCTIGNGNLDQSSSEQGLPPATVNRLHGAGVTAILPLPLFCEDGGRVVLTGSYDDHIRLLSIHDLHQTHGLKRVRVLVEMNLEGGVWRLELVSEPDAVDTRLRIRILASCMYAGARLIEFRRDAEDKPWSCDILGRFEEHKSMNYACAYMPGAPRHCISTSFYDRLLCLWDYTPISDGGS